MKTRPSTKASRPSARTAVALFGAAAALSVVGYLLVAWTAGYSGFPLDDAWIHQTYARNLATTGQLAYLPGQPSAGSTAPAWSFLLSAGTLLRIDPHSWTYLWGAIWLAASAWLVYRLFLRLAALAPGVPPPAQPLAALLAGLLCAVQWQLVWAAASGMETMMFTALSLALLQAFFAQTGQPAQHLPSLQQEEKFVGAVGLGLLAGVLVLTRPEGIILAGLVLAGVAVSPWPRSRVEVRSRLLIMAASLGTFAVLLVPYVAFNLRTGGSPWPNTFYAKQVEYQIDLSLPLRFWRFFLPTLAGPQLLLLPGAAYSLYSLARNLAAGPSRWTGLLPAAWWLALLAVYAWRLPVGYQHGRYSMPTIPLLLLYGAWGTAALLRPRSPRLVTRILGRALPGAVALLTLISLGRGAVAYRDDVAVIENEMVATARWLEANTDPGEVIAVHDIGAVGYLLDRPLLDMAGLITPEVIPFMHDAEALVTWMLEHDVSYAVFFPDFSRAYARLAADPRLQEVHCTGYAETRAAGHENLCVYRLAEL
jgi:hypothetical protein